MPKITLLNTQTNKTQDFEPVDAREVLGAPNTIYSVPQATRDEIGRLDKGVTLPANTAEGMNVPQLQGDPEMQIGMSQDKYARSDVVLAQAGNVVATPKVVTDTQGNAIKPLSAPVDFESMPIAQLQATLDQRGVQYTSKATKAELQDLVKNSQAAAWN